MQQENALTADRVAVLRSYLFAVRGHLEAKRIVPRGNVLVDRVLLALVSKSLRVAEAVCVLVAAGFCEEAFGLSRTVLEIALTARYITNRESEARAKRYADYFAKDHEVWTGVVAKYYPAAPARSDGEHLAMLDVARGFRNPHSWTGLGGQTREMAMELAGEADSPAVPAAWEFDYEAIYKWTSHYVHATSPAMFRHVGLVGLPFRVAAGKEPVEKCGPALFNAAMYATKCCSRCFPVLGLDFSELSADFDLAVGALRWN